MTQEVLPDDLEATFYRRSVHYSLKLSVKDTSTFSLTLINDDIPERWESDFTAEFVQEITTKVGNTKRFPVFVKMIQVAVVGSTEVTFDILTQEEALRGQSARSRKSEDKMYFVLNHVTQFENVHYPLPLKINPFTLEELKMIIRKYRKENIKLRNEMSGSQNRDRIHFLESQLHDIHETLTEIAPGRTPKRPQIDLPQTSAGRHRYPQTPGPTRRADDPIQRLRDRAKDAALAELSSRPDFTP